MTVTARDQRSHQWIACQRQRYRYSGHQRSVNLQLAWVVHRNGQTKTTAFGDWQVSDSDARLNHVILRPQTRRTSTWRLGVSHRREHPRGTLDLAVDYRRGTRWGNACAADQRLNCSASKDRTRASGRPSARHREEEREFMAGPDALTLSARASSAFTLAQQTFTLTTGYQYQTRTAPQTVNDTFAADGGWALRGMDAGVALFARRGWLLHHTLAWHRALATQDLYLSLDYGEMRGGADAGKPRWLRLAGAAVGVRGHLPRANLSYDVFAGLPLTTSAAGAAPVFLGFRLSWQY